MFLSSQLVLPAINGDAGGLAGRKQPTSQNHAWTTEAFWESNCWGMQHM